MGSVVRIQPTREQGTAGPTPLPRRVTDPVDRAPVVLDPAAPHLPCHALTLAGLPDQAAVLRRRIATTLPGATADMVQSLASELFNNAIIHTRSGDSGGEVTVAVFRLSGRTQVKVIDQGPREQDLLTCPHVREADPEREGGLGLRMVAAQASRWGTLHDRDRTTVWFELDRNPA